jgi:anti-anti-sigma factor
MPASGTSRELLRSRTDRALTGRLHCQGCGSHAADGSQAACPLALPAPVHAADAEHVDAEHLKALAESLVIEVEHWDGHVVVALIGELDLATACKLHFLLHELLTEHPRIVVDVTGLAFTDAIGIRILHTASAEASSSGDGWLRLTGTNPRLERLLRIARADSLLPVYQSKDVAMP